MDGGGVCRHCLSCKFRAREDSRKKARFRPVSGPGPSFSANSVGRAWRQARQKIWHPGGDSGTCRWRRERKAFFLPPEGASSGGHGWHPQSFTCHNSCMNSSGYLLFPQRGSSGDRASPDTKKGGLSVAFRYRGNVGWNEPAGTRPAWRSVRCWTPRVRSGCRGRSGGSFRVPQR